MHITTDLNSECYISSSVAIHQHETISLDTSITHIRPRFQFTVDLPYATVVDRITKMLVDTPANLHGELIDNHIILDIVGDEVHYWSPQLNFRLEEDEENKEKTIVSGLIGPRPPVWTMFMFVYFATGVVGFFISSYGVSKWILGEFSYTLLAFPAAIVFMLSAYQAGKYGEKLGADQVEMLKGFIREAIKV